MSDVFVSYAQPDEPHAERVVEALREAGYRVWRDDELPAHRLYAEVIEERIAGAKALVALWSAKATKSHWVRAEAASARLAGKRAQGTLQLAANDPNLDNLREDPRFQAMMRGARERVGLAPALPFMSPGAAEAPLRS